MYKVPYKYTIEMGTVPAILVPTMIFLQDSARMTKSTLDFVCHLEHSKIFFGSGVYFLFLAVLIGEILI